MGITTSVNGSQHQLDSPPPTAVEVLRETLGLTGTKLVCGTGTCGACVVLADEVPVASCLLPAEDLDGREVTTVEGLAPDEGLHPVQRAFLAHDGLQCGYCTPGFLIEAVAFYRAWRQERGDERPTREQVAKALAGHLCRCGAYQGIYEAVRAACAEEFEHPRQVDSRPDGLDKVTGRARYTTDVAATTKALEGAILRSPHPHAEVVSVDPGPALALPGVRAYIDLLEGESKVRYVGAPIGAVAAEDAETARRALEKVSVTYRLLRSAIGMKAADPEAPDILGWWIPPPNSEVLNTPMPKRGNVRGPLSILSTRRFTARRRIAQAREERDPLLVDGQWATSGVSHTALEPHSALARWDTNGRLTLHLSTQGVSVTREQLAKRLGLDADQVVVIAEHVGGAFGAKQGLTEEAWAAIGLSRATGSPVRVVYDRREELAVGGYRPGAQLHLALLAEPDLSISALAVEARSDGGASAGQLVASPLRFVYGGIPKSLLDYDVVSNAPPGKPFRGPIGGPVSLWALEQALDEAADRLGVDPVALRARLAPRPLRSRLYEWVDQHPLWRERSEPGGDGRFRRGIGVAFGSWFAGFDADTEVSVAVGEDGHLSVSSGSQDMGNGTRSVLAAAVADAFQLSQSEIEVHLGDSRYPWGPMSSGSRTTPSVYPAGREAAFRLQERIASRAAEQGLVGAEATPAGLNHAGETIPWRELLPRFAGESATARRPPDPRRPLSPIGYEHFWMGWGFTESAHIVDLEVDLELGEIRPRAVHSALAFGTVHSPQQATSQAHGAVVQGLGMALFEARVVDPNLGVTITADLDSFRIPGIADIPELQVEFIEEGFEHLTGGGAGMSELAIVGVPAAVGNALAHATGHRFRRLPVRPQDVVEARA